LAGTAVPAHRRTHIEACRSTGKHPPAATNTVRAATEQDSRLLTNKERFIREYVLARVDDSDLVRDLISVLGAADAR
jgi:hypothetical protein